MKLVGHMSGPVALTGNPPSLWHSFSIHPSLQTNPTPAATANRAAWVFYAGTGLKGGTIDGLFPGRQGCDAPLVVSPLHPPSQQRTPGNYILPRVNGSFLAFWPLRVESPRNTSMGIILKQSEKRNLRWWLI